MRGALWAHHRRLMPERQFHRILAYVYNNKYEYQIKFDQMEVVGVEWDGRVEVVTTPAGFIKRIRINPAVEDLPGVHQKNLILAAYGKACTEGRRLMAEAELRVYKQFLADLKPIVFGIRDNPEFFTVPEDSEETYGGTLKTSSPKDHHARTIPFAKAYQPSHAIRDRLAAQELWMKSPQGKEWAKTLKGKEFIQLHLPSRRPRGAPGPKKNPAPLEILAPYTPMDEKRLLQKNWMAYLDNKHVAEALWTRAKIADREKMTRKLQEQGIAWHRPVNRALQNRW